MARWREDASPECVTARVVEGIRSLHPRRRLLAVGRGFVRAVRCVTLRGAAVRCPVCSGTASRFVGAQADICPWCGTRPRQRFLWSYLAGRLGPGARVLHLAPEPALATRFRALSIGYTTADLRSPQASIHVDLSDGAAVADRLGRAGYDFVLCSHVLEHVPDDDAAIRSLASLVAPGGEVLVQVPLDPARLSTYEDWSITSPEARAEAFGQNDHIRIYGRDFIARLEGGGLAVTTLYPEPDLVQRLRLDATDPIYVCTVD